MISDVRTESPFWLMKSGFLEVYSSLSEDVKTDFVVIGGGISGALQAWHYLPPHLVKLYTTYALISKPLPMKEIWFENAVFWDTGNPYIYGRTTTDNRVIFGGGDEPFYSPQRREELLFQKTRSYAVETLLNNHLLKIKDLH